VHCACSDGELDRLVDEVVGQLKRLAITGNSRKDRMFLGVDVGRLGFVNKRNLRDMCVNHQLPCDDDIVDAVRTFSHSVYYHCRPRVRPRVARFSKNLKTNLGKSLR